MKTARKDNKTVWKIHTFVWKKKTLVIDRIELLLGWAQPLEKTVTDKVTFLQPEQESLPGSSNKLLSLICLKSDSLKLISQFCCSVMYCKT